MKKLLAVLTAVLMLMPAVTAFAQGNVTYSGNSGNFIFEPGSQYSPTDLFTDFKGVMPGDSISQTVTVHNNADDRVKAKVYIRALGAHEDSYDFLSQLRLRVEKVDSPGAYMFDANADETAQLTEWYYLGTIYSGGQVQLNVILDVPTSLDNTFADRIGYLDWEFQIEELPTEKTDPSVDGGDTQPVLLWIILTVSVVAVVILIFLWRREKKRKEADELKQN